MRFHPAIGGPPHPQALRLEQTGTQRETGLGADHGQTAAQDIDHLHRLPRQHPRRTTNRYLTQIVTGEPDDRESHHVRFGGGPLEKALHHRDLASGLPDPKADGRLRPLGIASLEDKIVQRAVVEVLNAVYEVDFRGFSYGFRPGRGPHDALGALAVGLERKRVNWVLDADIRDFFGRIDHSWLRRFIEHRVADKRIRRLIGKWLAAGVIEEGQWSASEVGSPQGASVSPLLANVYLHYVFDLWADWWRRHRANGDVIIVCFADDYTVGFQYEEDARRFMEELRQRLAKFGLELHPDKTRLIEFGRRAAIDRRRRGLGKPETFDFLGFTHICAKSRAGRFWVKRITIAKRMRAKLAEVKDQLKRRRHDPIPVQGRWLAQVLQGHMAYYAVPGNSDAVSAFRYQVTLHWQKALRRRSQRGRVNWERMGRYANRWLPRVRTVHPYPNLRLAART